MATTRGISFESFESLSVSHRLGRLVEAQLSEARQRTSTHRPEALGDLRAMVDALSSLSTICTTVLDDICARGQKRKPSAAVKEIENVFEWTEFLRNVNTETAPSDPGFLFRAHRYVGTSRSIFEPELDAPFNLEFKRTISVDEFTEFLARHLGKTQEEKETGNKVETPFLSMSPELEWTIHATGQKWNDSGRDDTVGLAIFDVKKLRQTSGLTVFHVSDILRFLENRGKEQLIPQGIQRWARNCDEYVSMGKINGRGLHRWVPGTELWASPMLSGQFFKAYTLAVYRRWRDEAYDDKECISVEDVCQKIIKFGKLLAGPRAGNLRPFVELILKPGVQFWELKTDASKEIVEARCHELVDGVMWNEFFSMRISN